MAAHGNVRTFDELEGRTAGIPAVSSDQCQSNMRISRSCQKGDIKDSPREETVGSTWCSGATSHER